MSSTAIWSIAALTSVLGLEGCCSHVGSAPRMTLTVGHEQLHAEIAATPEKREKGLMNRRVLPWNEGMILILEKPQSVCLWMRDTVLPLSAAFVDESGQIVELTDMEPNTDVSHCTLRPVRYVVEANRGWFKAAGAKRGDAVVGLGESSQARP